MQPPGPILRRIVGYGAIAVFALGALLMAFLMIWSVWKLHAFTTIFWELAFIFLVLSLTLPSLLKPPRPHPLKRCFTRLAIALALSVGGALASPTMNAWIHRG